MEEKMKALSLALLACAASFAVATTAAAEQCSGQITALQKQLSAPPGETSSGKSGDAAGGAQNAAPRSTPPNPAAAQDAQDHARQLDQAGREAECQAEMIEAKAAFGAQRCTQDRTTLVDG